MDLPSPLPYLEDFVDERAHRAYVIETTRQMSQDAGYALPAWLDRLCEQFIDGNISQDQLMDGVIRPFLH